MHEDPRSLRLFLKRVANRLGRPLGVNPFPRAFENPLAANSSSAGEIFDEIYRRNYWGSTESCSGVGSEVGFTARYRAGLYRLLLSRDLKKIFDAPCGDLNWISDLANSSAIDYQGGDISPSVVSKARQGNPGLPISVFDITGDEFPQVDVWHCRDCLFHLPFAAIGKALENYSRSSIPYALITSHRSRLLHKNLDVGFGGFRLLDLERPPISLPRPIARIPDFISGRDFPRYVCLWSREQILSALSKTRH